MKIIIVTDSPFPKGSAATNRILSYGKGFLKNGTLTTVYCLRANLYPEDYKEEIEYSGSFEGVKYLYTPKTSKRANSFFKRRWNTVKGLLNLYIFLRKENQYGKVSALILHSNYIVYVIALKIITNILNIRYIQEKSELPFVLRNKSFVGKCWANLYVETVYKQFDGILVETEFLKRYFSKKVNKKARLLVIPATIDPFPFLRERNGKTEFNYEYIYYAGSLDRSKKDGVDILIKSFKLIVKEFPKLKLIISGSSSKNDDLLYLKNIVNDEGLVDNVFFTGFISRYRLISYMKNAKILALAKENDKIQSGGLSSKIIEYLYTGKPVVLTDLQEITSHLTHKETAFLSKPNNVESFYQTLKFVLNNYDFAKKVGKSGQQFALSYFDYIKQTSKIITFINNLNKY